MVTEDALKRVLQVIMRNHMKALTSQREDNEAILEEL